MKNIHKAKYTLWVFILLNLFTSQATLNAAGFEILVLPTLMDSNMDGWYKIPPNSGPNIQKAENVYQQQTFSLLVLFSGYTADRDNNIHLRYDVQIFDPEGKPTEDKGENMLAYQGSMSTPETIVLNQQFLKIIFTEKYQFGSYKIKVKAYDKNTGNTFTSEIPIQLVPFAMPKRFESPAEVGKWLMGYYKNPTPAKAIRGVQNIIQINNEWLYENLNILTFFRNIFSDNPFLTKQIVNNFQSFSENDQKKFAIIIAISDNTSIFEKTLATGGKGLKNIYTNAQKINFPEVDGEIYTPVQLDILWAEFLTTGKYAPIKQIVSALALKNPENHSSTETDKANNNYTMATYGAAVWSLTSNCKQMPLVFKYCLYMYENENLDETIKNQLGSILQKVQSEIKHEKEKQK